MKLKELIEYLGDLDGDDMLRPGPCKPHVYHDDFSALAFELGDEPVAVGRLLSELQEYAAGAHFVGASCKFSGDTQVWTAQWEKPGETLGELALQAMLNPEGRLAARLWRTFWGLLRFGDMDPDTAEMALGQDAVETAGLLNDIATRTLKGVDRGS